MTNLTIWDAHPFSWLTDIDRTFDQLITRAFPARSLAGTTGFVPPAEIAREGDDALIRLELPGLDVGKDVTVEVTGRALTVRGERRDEHTSDDGTRVLRELRYGSFHRRFTLPAEVTAEAVTASYDAGVLTVRVAGAYAANGARRIEITTAAPAAVEAGVAS